MGEASFPDLQFPVVWSPTGCHEFQSLLQADRSLGEETVLRSLVSMYFGDAHLTDLVSNGPSSQWAFAELNVILGTPFADDKRQPFAASGTFLGLDYDDPKDELCNLLGT